MKRTSHVGLRPAALASLGLALAALFAVAFAAPVAAQEMWCLDADEVYATVDDSRIRLFHLGALYNCCNEPFAFEIAQEEATIYVREIEVLENPCYCVCCFHIYLELVDVAPGDYVIEYSWYDYESEAWRTEPLEVSVPDLGQTGPVALGAHGDSDCLEAASLPEPEIEDPDNPATWGAIKALFD